MAEKAEADAALDEVIALRESENPEASDDAPPAADGSSDPAPEGEALASQQADQAPAASQRRSRDMLGQIVRGVVRPLLVIITSQYIIVTVLIVIAAMTLSRQASDLINDKFEAITRALRQYQ